jgi:hypothetical protein
MSLPACYAWSRTRLSGWAVDTVSIGPGPSGFTHKTKHTRKDYV